MTILKRTVIVIFCISLLIFIVAVVKELISSADIIVSSIPFTKDGINISFKSLVYLL